MLRGWSCLPSAPWLRPGLENEATPLKSLTRAREGLTAHTAHVLSLVWPALARVLVLVLVCGYHTARAQPATLPRAAPKLLAAPLDFTG